MTGYSANIEELVNHNNNFRQVIFTGQHLQVVVMSLLPNEEIGMEVHASVDQFFRLEKGTLKFVVDGDESVIGEGSIYVVKAGSQHNVINVGSEPAKFYTIYAPPNHPDGIVHATKADATKAEIN